MIIGSILSGAKHEKNILEKMVDKNKWYRLGVTTNE